jgi:multisubunit Na+/H+ antiporter MnhB subunit
MAGYEILFLKALFYTILIETVILFLLVKTIFRKAKLNNTVILFAGILASSTTLPYLWFVLPRFISNKFAYIAVGELSVVFIESLIYYFIFRIKYSYSLFISIICNLCSFLAGLFIIKV